MTTILPNVQLEFVKTKILPIKILSESDHKNRINTELIKAGISKWGQLKMETRYLPKVIDKSETIGGITYGHTGDESVMMIATDKRVIYLDVKPYFVRKEDITYAVVSGIDLDWVGWRGTITLHTRIRDIKIHTLNQKAAKIFQKYIGDRVLKTQNLSLL